MSRLGPKHLTPADYLAFRDDGKVTNEHFELNVRALSGGEGFTITGKAGRRMILAGAFLAWWFKSRATVYLCGLVDENDASRSVFHDVRPSYFAKAPFWTSAGRVFLAGDRKPAKRSPRIPRLFDL